MQGRVISVTRLKQLLDEVPNDVELFVNQLGNLGMRGSSGVYFGYIDLDTEEINVPEESL